VKLKEIILSESKENRIIAEIYPSGVRIIHEHRISENSAWECIGLIWLYNDEFEKIVKEIKK